MPVTIDVETIGTYSTLADKSIILNDLPPRLNDNNRLYGTLKEELNLKTGQTFEDIDCEESLFDYLRMTSKQGTSLKEVIDANFIASSRILNALARSAYNITPLEFQAIRQNDVIFLFDRKSSSENIDSSISCLQKFKQYMTLDKKGNPYGEHDEITNEKVSSVVNRATISSGNFKIKVLYSSKIDAVDKENNFVELKTTALGHNKWVEKQSLRHYFHSFFANVPYAVYGHRANMQEQTIHKIEKIQTSNIPNYRVNWKNDVCFSQLFSVLQKIESRLEYEDEAVFVIPRTSTRSISDSTRRSKGKRSKKTTMVSLTVDRQQSNDGLADGRIGGESNREGVKLNRRRLRREYRQGKQRCSNKEASE